MVEPGNAQVELSTDQSSEVLGEEVRFQRDALGCDVHPDLGKPWFRYGSALLKEIEESVTGEGVPGGPDSAEVAEEAVPPKCCNCAWAKEDGHVILGSLDGPDESCERLEELEEDLEVAWEALETARRCLEQKEPSFLLAQCHLRIADLLCLQGHKSSAVEECKKALTYCQTDEEKAQAKSHLATLELLAEPNRDAVPEPEGLESSAFPDASGASTTGNSAEPMQVPVRKRKRVSGEEPEACTEH
ncbi:unnamed protein product [Cladocopium goreaui]|uniref:Uncharacterized protein n=1 Tax=Cladocopium goreaui TaxID=2562237 RepID=A0A9P1C004_9DINO|nr:unnamed protein product [Cladocopium goreaui]